MINRQSRQILQIRNGEKFYSTTFLINVLAASLVLFFTGNSARATVIGATSAAFDFNGLSPGNLVGQDGWLGDSGVASPLLQIGSGVNSTLAATGGADLNESGVDQFAVHEGGGADGLLGVGGNSGRFLTLDIEARSLPANWAVVGLGQVAAGGSIFSSFKFGFFFGIIQESVWMAREGSGSIASADLNTIKPTFEVGDWYQVRMAVDLAANGGNGVGSLLIRDLTDGEGNFTTVPGCQNINLQLLASPAANPLQWDGMAIWIRSGFGGSGAVDNIAYAAVPEPKTATITYLLAITLVIGKIRRAVMA